MPAMTMQTKNNSTTPIQQASQAIENGFYDYYQTLVNYFHHNAEQNLNYHYFANRTNRAKNALACEREAIFYMVAYGWQHHQSMQHLLSKTISFCTDDSTSATRIVDYGCGQGVATLAFLDYFAQHADVSMPIEIQLIEPSAVSLGIAQLLVERLATVLGLSVTVHTQNCTLSQSKINFQGSADQETFHLMSNILDISEVQSSLPALAEQMATCSGKNFLFATCPDYSNTQAGFRKISSAMPFAEEFHNACWSMNYHLYRVVQGRWQDYKSNQRMMGLVWEG